MDNIRIYMFPKDIPITGKKYLVIRDDQISLATCGNLDSGILVWYSINEESNLGDNFIVTEGDIFISQNNLLSEAEEFLQKQLKLKNFFRSNFGL